MLALTSLLCLTSLSGAAQSLPPSIENRLTTGVNITRWFCYLKDPADTSHYRNYLTQADFHAFRRLNLRFVRLCVSPEAIYDHGHPNQKNLKYLDAAVARLEKAGLAVLLDLHDNGQLKLDMNQDNSGFVSFWQDMTRHYRGRAEGSTVFELVNEPVFIKNPEAWYMLQQKTVRAVRAIDPDRTIMVSPTSWSSIDTLATMKALPEKNLVYTFHCYDPFTFTHQGAGWAGEQQKALRDIPFPSSPEAVAAMIDKIPAEYQGAVKWYGEQRYDAKYLGDRLRTAMNWGRQNHVPVVLGEFGAYPPVSPVPSRTRWFAAMRQAIQSQQVPNAIWGYDDGLGLGREMSPTGTLKLDPVVLKSFYGISLRQPTK